MKGENLTEGAELCGALMKDSSGEFALRCLLDKDHAWPVHYGAWVRHPNFPPGLKDLVAEVEAAVS